MNSVGQPLQQRALSKRAHYLGRHRSYSVYYVSGAPSLLASSPEGDAKVISKAEAREKAAAFAAQQLGLTVAADDEWTITYQTDSSFFGYMFREKLLEDYTKNKLDQRYPYDVYHAGRSAGEEKTSLTVDLNMYTGLVAGFARGVEASSGDTPFGGAGSVTASENSDSALTSKLEQKKNWPGHGCKNGEPIPGNSKIEPNAEDAGLAYTDSSVKVGESRLQYNFAFAGGEVSSFKAGFSAPTWHTSYVESQTSLAKKLTLFGYGLPTLALGILALIYSILRRGHTSFARGAFLSGIHFVIMMISTYNMLPDTSGESAQARITAVIMFIIYVLYSLLMSSLLYFSLVGGNGLWRKEEGLNPWPRAKEPGYGKYVLDSSIRAGYIWAFVLLGVQTVMFIILSYTLNNWSTTDATQSPYNMRYAWLLPIGLWLARASPRRPSIACSASGWSKIVRSTFAASLITTVIWAFGHTLYPIYPVSSRPIELTVIGLLFSYIFLRYGFIAVMFSHVVFDSILMGATLIFMKESVNVGAGIFAIVMPFLVGYIVYRFNPGLRRKSGRLNKQMSGCAYLIRDSAAAVCVTIAAMALPDKHE